MLHPISFIPCLVQTWSSAFPVTCEATGMRGRDTRGFSTHFIEYVNQILLILGHNSALGSAMFDRFLITHRTTQAQIILQKSTAQFRRAFELSFSPKSCKIEAI